MWKTTSKASSELETLSLKTRFVRFWTEDGASLEQEAGTPEYRANETKRRRARWALMSMSFFMGDVQQGLGPFLGVFLQQNGWAPGLRGSVTFAGGMTALAFHAPLGALIDKTTYKRTIVISSFVVIILATLVILLQPVVWVVFLCQILTSIAGIVPVPAMTAMTLGVTRQNHFHKFNGINQAFNHAGMMTGAGVSAAVGSRFGLSAVFYFIMALGGAAILSVLVIPASAIDHDTARGMELIHQDAGVVVEASSPGADGAVMSQKEQPVMTNDKSGEPVEKPKTPVDDSTGDNHKPTSSSAQKQQFQILFRNKALLILAGMLLAFHFGNAAVLPFYGQAVVAAGKGNPAAITGLTVVVAQGVMVPMSFLAAHFGATQTGWRGYWLVMLVSFASLPVRCVLAGSAIEAWGIWPVQILDGIGAGLQSVSTPGVVARVLGGTGRVNVGLGAVMMCQNIGAALSNLFCGWLVQERGYSVSFYVLGIFPLIAVAMLFVFYRTLSRSGVFLKA